MTTVWKEINKALRWDALLTELNGHPLQSAQWGESRRIVDGLDSLYLLLGQPNHPLCMARVETRHLPLMGKVAWVPRGPTLARGQSFANFEECLADELRRRGYCLLVTDEYRQVTDMAKVRTIWVDLEQGAEALMGKIDKQWMYGTRRAKREGVEVVRASSSEEVSSFYQMCAEISLTKGFDLPGSELLMQTLLQNSSGAGAEMHLFLAKHQGRIGAGVFAARSGSHVHYLWGASDRELSSKRVGEAVQWAVIEWAMEQGCKHYDLEGIDPVKNPGVYQFKKKMGGKEVSLCGKRVMPLTSFGRLAGLAGSALGKL